jgi:hypothetical protein
VRPAGSSSARHWQEGDGVYVYARSRTAFHFYARKYGFGEEQVVVYPGGVWNEFLDGLSQFRGRERVWVVVSGMPNAERFFLAHLDRRGERRDTFASPGVMVGLHDLTRPRP